MIDQEKSTFLNMKKKSRTEVAECRCIWFTPVLICLYVKIKQKYNVYNVE